MDSVGEGEGGKIWENGIETCKISCMKRVASPGSMHDTGCLGLVHWDDPEGWNGEGGGRGVRDGEYMYTCGRFILSTILDAWGWCTGTTQRDGMGWEGGGGLRMGNACIPVADSF